MSMKNHSELMTVPVTMPSKVWGKLARIADRDGCKVRDLVATAVKRIIDADGVCAEDEAYRRAIDAVTRGWDDLTIAEQLRVPRVNVSAWREQAGMKACPPGYGEGPI